MYRLTLLSTLLLSTSIASADLAQDVAFDLGRYAGAAIALEHGADHVDPKHTIEGCYQVIADARAAGFHGDMRDGDFEHIEGVRVASDTHYLAFARATHSVCDRFARAHRLAAAGAALVEPRRRLVALGEPAELGYGWAGKGPEMLALARKCSRELDALLAAGAPADAKIPGWNLAIPESKAAICEQLAKRAATLEEDVKTATSAAYDRIAKPYQAVGIAGDKLQLLVDHDGYGFYGVGGAELTTPAQLAKAKVIFEVVTRDGVATVRRYPFAGNKLQDMTSESYAVRPSSHAFR